MVGVSIFKMLVRDDRCDAPRRYVVEAASRQRAEELARLIFGKSPHYAGLEVWDGKALVLSLCRPLSACSNPFVDRPGTESDDEPPPSA